MELCGNLASGGGTTPSMGLFKAVRRATQGTNVSVMVMVRPRTGDFTFSALEMDVMLEDIRAFKQAGADGFVFGVLTADGRVDIDRTFMSVPEILGGTLPVLTPSFRLVAQAVPLQGR